MRNGFLALGLTGTLVLTGCGGGSGPSVAACTKVMRVDLAKMKADPSLDLSNTKPAECNGLSKAQLDKVGAAIGQDLLTGLGQRLGQVFGDSPTASPSTDSTSPTRAALEADWNLMTADDRAKLCTDVHIDAQSAATDWGSSYNRSTEVQAVPVDELMPWLEGKCAP